MTVTRNTEQEETQLEERGSRRDWIGWCVAVFTVLAWLGIGGVLGAAGMNLGEVTQGDTASYLPDDIESAQAMRINESFAGEETLPAIVVYESSDRLDAGERDAIRTEMTRIGTRLEGILAGRPVGPMFAEDGEAARVVVPFSDSDSADVTAAVEQLRTLLSRDGAPDSYVTGPAGFQADLDTALSGIDLMLVGVTALAILVILMFVYRSPLLPLLVLTVAGTSLAVTRGVIYLLAEQGWVSLGEEVKGILNVLVLGAGTDYALLLVGRFRESLRSHANRFDAMRVAWRSAAGPIVASSATVALGLLCLLAADLALDADLGPVGAIGVACALVAMLTLMPAILTLFGRAAFWPFRPRLGSEHAQRTPVWSRIAAGVVRRPRRLWIGTALVLGILALGVFRLDADGIPRSELVIGNTQASAGQQALGRHFPAGTNGPAFVVTDAGTAHEVAERAQNVNGVASATPYTGSRGQARNPGTTQPRVVDGHARVDVVLSAAPDSDAAKRAVRDLRTELAGVKGAEAKVGGYTAVTLDFNSTAKQDRLVMPLLLAVVLLVLILLLRALIAPLLLVATVVLSFGAAIGVSGIVFQNLMGFPGVDATYVLQSFVFLVALGIDYNIFLMTRVREETVRVGTRRGTVAGLTLTGGVITSAGVVLAATFSALAVIPLVLLVELAFTVAFGVLLDTLVVRSLMVPALTTEVGRWMWWPSKLSREEYE